MRITDTQEKILHRTQINTSKSISLNFEGTSETDWADMNRLIDLGLIELFIGRLPTEEMGARARLTAEGRDFLDLKVGRS